MAIKEALLPEWDQEMSSMRKVLERVPDDKFGYQPHAKSMSLGRLASHLAELPQWGVSILGADEFDIAPPGAPEYKATTLTSRAELLAAFDQNAKAAREKLSSMDDATYMSQWTFKKGGQTMFVLPKVAVVRSFLMNHMIHHRGQASVYLRMIDVPVPSIYGPSADESGM